MKGKKYTSGEEIKEGNFVYVKGKKVYNTPIFTINKSQNDELIKAVKLCKSMGFKVIKEY